VSGSRIAVTVSGAAIIGDKVDVTKLSFYDLALGKTYSLTNSIGTGSVGAVIGETQLMIQIGSVEFTELQSIPFAVLK